MKFNFNRPAEFVCLAFLLSGCSGSIDRQLERAAALAREGKAEDARLVYAKILRSEPKHGEALYQLAEFEFQAGRTWDGFQNLRAAGEILPDDPRVQTRLGEFALTAYLANPGRPQEFYRLVETVASRLERLNPPHPQAIRYRAFLALSNKKTEEAIQGFRSYLAAQPRDAQARFNYAQALRTAGRLQESDREIDRLMAESPEFPLAYDMRAEDLYLAGRRAEAEAVLQKKAEALPEDAEPLVQLAHLQRRQGRAAEADTLLDSVLQSPEKYPDGGVVVGDYWSRLGDRDRAIQAYKSAAGAAGANSQAARRRLVGALIESGRFNDAQEMLNRLVKEDSRPREVELVQAYLWIQAGEKPRLNDAIRILQEAARDGIREPSLHWFLGVAYAGQGDRQAAAREWAMAAAASPLDNRPRVALARMLLEENRSGDALEISDSMLAVNPRNLDGHVLRVQCLEALGRLAEARKQLQVMKPLVRAPQLLDVENALLSLREGQGAAAERILKPALARNPSDDRLLSGVVRALVLQNRSGEAIRLLQEAVHADPSRPVPRILLAEGLMAAGKPEEAAASLQPLVEASPAHLSASLLAAQIELRRGQPAKALNLLTAVQAQAPQSLAVLVPLAEAQWRSGQGAAAAGTYRECLKVSPGNAALQRSLAYILADSGGDLTEARDLSEQALRKDSGSPDSLSTLGYVTLREGKAAQAAEIFQRLAQQNPKNALVHYHLGLALRSSDPGQAARAFEAAMQMGPDPYLERSLRSALESAGRRTELRLASLTVRNIRPGRATALCPNAAAPQASAPPQRGETSRAAAPARGR